MRVSRWLRLLMFARELHAELLVRPFDTEVRTGSYWLTWLKSRHMSPATELFRHWILAEAANETPD